MNDRPPKDPVDRHAAQRKVREERLAAALRANLKRRKTAARQTGADESPAEGGGKPEQD